MIKYLLILLTFLFSTTARAETVTVTRFIDGDTFEIARADGEIVTLRLAGIDTPETWRPECENERTHGGAAKFFAQGAIQEAKKVELFTDEETGRYERLIGRLVLDGKDLGELLIEMKLAERWPNTGNIWCDEGWEAHGPWGVSDD